MDKNTKEVLITLIGSLCAAIIISSLFFALAWIGTPKDFTFNINITSDNNTLEIVKIMNQTQYNAEAMNELQKTCYSPVYCNERGGGK